MVKFANAGKAVIALPLSSVKEDAVMVKSPPATVPAPAVESYFLPELEFKHNKAGVSASTSQDPEISVYSLPATLRMLVRNSSKLVVNCIGKVIHC
jgi:hypothetical protein